MIDKISEVDDLKSRGRLESLQAFVLDTDTQQDSLDNSLLMRKGRIEAGEILETQLRERVRIVQRKVDAEEVAPEVAKLLINEIVGCADHVHQFTMASRNDVVLLQGRKLGLEQAATIAKKRFDAEVSTYERHKALEAEMEEDRELRRKTPKKASGKKKPQTKRRK